jgi:chloramphenicol-sensitive protein RarD
MQESAHPATLILRFPAGIGRNDRTRHSETVGSEYGVAVVDVRERNGVRVGMAAYLIWGLLTVYWKQLSAFDALELIGWRMVTAAVVMAVITTARGTWPTIISAFRSRTTVGRLVVAALLLTCNWGSYVWAVVNDRVIETALGYFIAPLVTMAIGVFVLGERPNNAQRIAFGCASIAVVILTIGAGQPPWIALILAATWSSYALSKRNIGLGAIDSLTGETLVLFVPAVVLTVALSSRSDSAVDAATGVEWGFLLGTGLITAIPLMLFASAAQSIPFTLLGPLNLLVPVINFGLGWALYGEPMPANRLIGFAFVWVALIVVMTDRIRFARRQRREQPVAVA